MAELPSGTVTFLFTDIEGSTRLLQRLGDGFADLLELHHSVLRDAFTVNAGVEVDTQGDAFFVAFRSATAAVRAAVAAQRALAAQTWPGGLPLRVRMGIHTGQAGLRAENYVGLDVHRAARISAAGHGGQVLLSEATRSAMSELPGVELRDLGLHRLKDLELPHRLFQVVAKGLESEFAALKTLENRPTNLPIQPTPLVGRAEEIARIVSAFSAEHVRLLTLTGPGGSGKTRLALQAAAELIERFPDGVFLVTLAPITDPTLVVPTIAQTLGVRELPGQLLAEALAEYLRDRRVLLVLDNFEQVLPAAPSLVPLLAHAPDVALLATSRAPLHLSGEQEFAVPPLGAPELEPLPELEVLSQYDAVALFIQRARGVRSAFALTDQNAAAVAEICVRLDGLPLAIELAAARVRALPPHALLKRLDRRLGLLTGGAADAPARQQTLRAAIDWSHALLGEPERVLFARLGVFAGGWDLQAAETVCGDGLDVLESLSSLIENSLVREEDDAQGEPRYAMLETIREFAVEKLEERGEESELCRRHAEFFLALSERARRTLRGDDVALDDAPEQRVLGELPNLRAAQEWALAFADPSFVLRLAGSAAYAWNFGGRPAEGREWMMRALAATGPGFEPEEAQALTALAALEVAAGSFEAGEATNTRALELYRAHGTSFNVARVLLDLAECAALRRNIDRARELLREARMVGDPLGNGYLNAGSFFVEALTASWAGDHLGAQRLLEHGLELMRAGRIPRRLWAFQLINVGWFALQSGDFARARSALEEYLADDHAKNPIGVANAHSNLGLIALYEQDRDEAQVRFRLALALARAAAARPTIAESLLGLASVAAIDGDAERASCIAAVASVLHGSMGVEPSEPEAFMLERYIGPAETSLDEDTRRAARERGRAMTLDEAVVAARG